MGGGRTPHLACGDRDHGILLGLQGDARFHQFETRLPQQSLQDRRLVIVQMLEREPAGRKLFGGHGARHFQDQISIGRQRGMHAGERR